MRFVWKKKIERDISRGINPGIYINSEKKRQRERMAEIKKVKRRRMERAIEKAHYEEEMAMLARERSKAEFQDWEKKEEEFHFDQSKLRSMIRLREGRVKPIDIFAKNLDCSDDFDIEINKLYMVFKGLTVRELEELWDDIKMYLNMDRSTETRIRFWEMAEEPDQFSRRRQKRGRVQSEYNYKPPPPEVYPRIPNLCGLHRVAHPDMSTEKRAYREYFLAAEEIFKPFFGLTNDSPIQKAIDKFEEICISFRNKLHIIDTRYNQAEDDSFGAHGSPNYTAHDSAMEAGP